MTVPVFPDAESMVLYALVPLNPDVRFVTVMPSGQLTQTTARVRRVSGASRDIQIDRPIVDIDVFGLKSEVGNVSASARQIQSDLLSLMGATVANGVIQHVNTIVGPRQIPEANVDLVRYAATYELQVHS
jgi:hypothetical protein